MIFINGMLSCETLVCMLPAAVDGLVAATAAFCQRTSRCQLACLLPPERRASLRDVPEAGVHPYRSPTLPVSVSLYLLEGTCSSGCRCNAWILTRVAAAFPRCGRCSRYYSCFFLRAPRTIALHPRPSDWPSSHPHHPSVDPNGTSDVSRIDRCAFQVDGFTLGWLFIPRVSRVPADCNHWPDQAVSKS